ncbi:MAG: type II secretion system F family protein [Candidatus Riflebacteria bacterium]|nr:type II secretion system F family protein [Candidatus Riflebacteria bacterium]
MNFQYKARKPDGTEIQDVVEAADEREAVRLLSSQGVLVTRVSRGSSGLSLNTEIRALTWIPSAVYNAFLIQLSMFIRSGVPLAEALASLEGGETHRSFKRVIADVLREVEKGRSFSSALTTHPEVFDSFFTSMIRIAEAGGVLEQVLDKLAKINQRSVTLKSQIIGAVTYPILLVTVATAVMFLLFSYVLPRFAGIFQMSNLAIPLPTQILMGISSFTTANFSLLLLALVSFFVLCFLAIVTTTGRSISGEIFLRLPVTGPVVQSYLVVHISETLGLLLGAGVPLLELLLAVENTLTMPTARRLIETMRNYVERGSTLRLSLEGNIVFPAMVLKLVETGEKTGNLDKVFDEVAVFYDNSLQTTIRAALSIIEPALLVIIAGFVGFVMLAIIMPIFKMSSAMRSSG